MSIPHSFDPMGTAGGVRLPDGYTRLKAIYCSDNPTSTLSTATRLAINLRYCANERTRWELTFERRQDNTACNHGSVCNITSRFMVSSNNSNIRCYVFDSGFFPNPAVIPYSGMQKIIIDAPNKLFIVNGQNAAIPFTSAQDFSALGAKGELYVFARNNNGKADYAGNGTCYGSKIFEDGVLVRNYVPAHEDATGLNGLYETVTRQFMPNINANYNFTAVPL